MCVEIGENVNGHSTRNLSSKCGGMIASYQHFYCESGIVRLQLQCIPMYGYKRMVYRYRGGYSGIGERGGNSSTHNKGKVLDVKGKPEKKTNTLIC